MVEVKEKYKKFMFNRRFDTSADEDANAENEIKNLLGTESHQAALEATELEKIIKDEEVEEVIALEEVYTPPTYTQEQLDEAIAKAKNEGVIIGKKESEESIAKVEADAIIKLEAMMEETKKTIENDAGREKTEFISLCSMIVKKIFPNLERRDGIVEIETIIADNLPKLTKEPRLKIAVNPTQTPLLKEKLTNIAKKAGFLGKIVIQNNEDLKLSDVKMEWEKGGISRDSGLIMSEVDRILGEYADNRKTIVEKDNV